MSDHPTYQDLADQYSTYQDLVDREPGATYGDLPSIVIPSRPQGLPCPPVAEVAARARELADACGCRNSGGHHGVARAQLEIEAEHREDDRR